MNIWKSYMWTADWKNYLTEDHRSYISNLCSCKKKAWEKFRLVRDSNPWPLRYRCSVLPIKLKANWEQVVKLVRYKPVRRWWWNYEYMKIIYVNCGVKNYLKEDHCSYIHNLWSCEKKVWKKKSRLVLDPNLWLLRDPCSHRQPKRTKCGLGLHRSFGRNILELLVYYLMPNINSKILKCSILDGKKVD